MRSLFILVTALTFLVACKDKTETKTEKDTSNTTAVEDTKNEDKTSEPSTINSTEVENNSTTTAAGWSAKDVRDFTSNCISEAVKGGMQQTTADRYCNCMQVNMERLYPDVQKAALLTNEDFSSPSMKQMVQDCLTGK